MYIGSVSTDWFMVILLFSSSFDNWGKDEFLEEMWLLVKAMKHIRLKVTKKNSLTTGKSAGKRSKSIQFPKVVIKRKRMLRGLKDLHGAILDESFRKGMEYENSDPVKYQRYTFASILQNCMDMDY
ncbi:hypothetical protein D5086_006988 [Populus alba]|uniref:Uncharacterized protein n=1 Tax=Populus alba TaxID=43335 RepID=A0ACC4CNB7_POPAL